MKTERRRELHSNELVQQIDQLGDYVRQNATRLIAVSSVVIVLAIAVTWYVKGKQARIMDGWATLSDPTLAADPESAVGRYRRVATDSTNIELKVAAWLQIGETAMGQLIMPAPAGDATGDVSTSGLDWRKTAAEAYENVLQHAGNRNATARGHALIMLGVLAEDQGDFDQARKRYNTVIEKAEFANTPLPKQAEYRLAGLDRWSKPVTFPPAAITVPAPDATSSTSAESPTEMGTSFMSPIQLRMGEDGQLVPVEAVPTESPAETPAGTSEEPQSDAPADVAKEAQKESPTEKPAESPAESPTEAPKGESDEE